MFSLLILVFIIGFIYGMLLPNNDEVLWGYQMFTGGSKPSTQETQLQVMYTSVWLNRDE